MPQEHPQHLYDQLIKLGDMMGDGLHYEPGGGWITKEYKKLQRILCPDIKEIEKERRELRNKIVDNRMALVLGRTPCSCGGAIKQARSGSYVAYCEKCNLRYKGQKVR